jgi:transposase
MGQATPLDKRCKVIDLKTEGLSNAQVAEQLNLSLGTVKELWKRYRLKGDTGLATNQKNSGRCVDSHSELTYRLVRLIKHIHDTWGVPYILIQIKEKFPDLKLDSIRQYQRRLFEASGELPPNSLPPALIAEKARIAHDLWEIDAKERQKTLDGIDACYLTIADKGTGSLIAAKAFPPQSD